MRKRSIRHRSLVGSQQQIKSAIGNDTKMRSHRYSAAGDGSGQSEPSRAAYPVHAVLASLHTSLRVPSTNVMRGPSSADRQQTASTFKQETIT